MKAFITGGTGFIGSHLADKLIENGAEEVRCMVRSDAKWLTGKSITQVKGNLDDIPALRDGLQGVDVLFHLAALVKAPKQEILNRTNVEATENLIRTAQRVGVKKIVILSSLAATGPSFGRPVTEKDPLMPISMYGRSKQLMEEMIHSIATKHDSISILRPPAVFGPREEQIYSFFKMCAKGFCPIIGDGESTRISMVHVADVIQGLMLASNDTSKGIKTYFVSSEELYTWNQIKDATSNALQRKLYTLYVPSGVVKSIGTVIETAGSIIGKYPVMNKDKALEMTHEWICSVDAIKNDLGYTQQVSLEDGITDTIKWYKKHNWI
jgi:nucleoside-diphosphate-sugar epimerase